MDFEIQTIVEPLLVWFRSVKRFLPWRDDPTPYHVWISEIMLQQTRIEAVLPYYARFLAAFPTPLALANATDDNLMKQWEGLGYYSRARNLRKTAQILEAQYGGTLPADEKALLALPGIGPYTAGAIGSIAFGLPIPAVDGNVLRVLSRLLNDERDVMLAATKADMTARLRAVYPTGKDAGDFTQALMELGQRVCVPGGSPACASCPLGAFCQARLAGRENSLPVRTPPKARKIVERTVFILRVCRENACAIAVQKRPEKGLLSGLWEFPGAVDPLSAPLASLLVAPSADFSVEHLPPATHIFTHVEWHMQGIRLTFARRESALAFAQHITRADALVWVSPQELHAAYPIPSAFRAFLPYLEN